MCSVKQKNISLQLQSTSIFTVDCNQSTQYDCYHQVGYYHNYTHTDYDTGRFQPPSPHSPLLYMSYTAKIKNGVTTQTNQLKLYLFKLQTCPPQIEY